MFWADFSRAKNNQASILETVNKKISLKRKVPVFDWNAHKGNPEALTKKLEYLTTIWKKLAVFLKAKDLKLEHKLITSQAIKARYLGEDEHNHSVIN